MLQLSWWRRLVTVILPAAAPAILAGLRISIGSAWVAIVAGRDADRRHRASATSSGTSGTTSHLTSVIFAILAIGLIGVLLDAGPRTPRAAAGVRGPESHEPFSRSTT